MRRQTTQGFIIVAMLTFSMQLSFAQTTNKRDNLEQAKQEIAKSNAIYFQSFIKNDPSVFLNAYAEDACLMFPSSPMLCGKKAIAGFFRSAYDDYGLRNGSFTTVAVYGDANEFVTEEVLWKSFNAKGELFDEGKSLVVWKKTDAGWKMYRDSFSSNKDQ